MAGKGYGNFAFMYDIHRGIYDWLSIAEKNARLNIQNTGNPIRQALELFVKDLIGEHGLSADIPLDLDLAEKLRLLNDERTLRAAGYLAPGQRIDQKPLLPYAAYDRVRRRYAYEVRYTVNKDNAVGFEVESGSYYYLVRKVGNTFSHPEENQGDPRKTFDNLCIALDAFYKILIKRYRVKNMPAFSRNKMPIGEFIVDSTMEPEDKILSGCTMEFMAHIPSRLGKTYALLRQYPKGNLDENFIQRNADCFDVATMSTPSGVPDGMTRMRALNQIDSNNEFYVIAYLFNQPAQVLSNEILRKLSLQQRLELCKELVEALQTLHTLAHPIQHRLLNFNSIYVTEYENKWTPHIVKLDFAKINIGVPIQGFTVGVQAAEASAELLKQQLTARYLAPEWKTEKTKDVNWEQVDIYSLGVMLLDILNGQSSLVSIDTVIDQVSALGLPESLVELVAEMTNEASGQRTKLAPVLAAFKEVI